MHLFTNNNQFLIRLDLRASGFWCSLVSKIIQSEHCI